MLKIIPTDTCYGLAGSLNQLDYAEIYERKGRDFTKPLAILVRSYDDMDDFIEILIEQKKFLQKYPFPWSILGQRIDQKIFPEYIRNPQYINISLRVAEVCIPESVRDQLEYPLFLTSANLSGKKESQTLIEAQKAFPGIMGYDGGICDQPPSDIFSIGEDGELIYLRRNYGLII